MLEMTAHLRVRKGGEKTQQRFSRVMKRKPFCCVRLELPSPHVVHVVDHLRVSDPDFNAVQLVLQTPRVGYQHAPNSERCLQVDPPPWVGFHVGEDAGSVVDVSLAINRPASSAGGLFRRLDGFFFQCHVYQKLTLWTNKVTMKKTHIEL